MLFVDTCIWSLALRHDTPASNREVKVLVRAIESGETLLTTGLVLQELLQGFLGPKDRARILDRFASVPLLLPDRDDHVRAAMLRNHCRRNGVQVRTIDALLAQLCMRHDLTMLSADKDFRRIAAHSTLRLWNEP